MQRDVDVSASVWSGCSNLAKLACGFCPCKIMAASFGPAVRHASNESLLFYIRPLH